MSFNLGKCNDIWGLTISYSFLGMSGMVAAFVDISVLVCGSCI